MIYEIRNGLNVCKQGWIIVDHVSHYIKEGYVVCNASLNSRAWNITESKETCPICRQKAVNNSRAPAQLEIAFDYG